MEKETRESEQEHFTSEKTAEDIEDNNKSLYKDIKRKDQNAKDNTTGGF